jgi:tripartite-type tricarboxylate transporter receptor subunit TctC
MFPDIPTVAEAGVEGFAVDNWYGFIGPRGIPKSIVNKLHSEINRSLTLPDVKTRLEAFGIFPFLLPSPEAFADYIKLEIAKYAQVVKASGARPE